LVVPQVSSIRKRRSKTMRPGALPLSEQIILDIIAPPIITGVWWIMARGWAASVQGGSASETTKKRQKWEFLAILLIIYVLAIGITIYGQFS
jgi:hypothetical protein